MQRVGLSAASRHNRVVLSIGKLTAQNAEYCQRTVAQGGDDYYAGRGEAPGEWQGAGAAALGLSGEVGADAFRIVMIQCRDPESGEKLANSSCRKRILAYDLTFSAPKSVSVLYAVADERTSRALCDAHDEAVRAALAYLEREACFVRRGHTGAGQHAAARHRAEGFVSAAYRHRMSRAQDPQLHTHVVTANLARYDGRWSALDGYALYKHAKAAGYLYEAHLRHAVRERLPWVRFSAVEKGIADVEGVPEEVLREFSRRRAEIQEWLEREGRSGRRSAEKAALATREPKAETIDTPSWREAVRARAAEHGLGRDEFAALTAEVGAERRDPGTEELGSRLVGPRGMTERRNTFAVRDVLIEWAATHRDGATVERIEAAAASFLRRREIVPLRRRGERAYTTDELLERERAIVDAAAARRGEGIAAVEPRRAERFLRQRGGALSDQQRAVVLGLTTSGHGIEAVEALAGTGKTHLAGALRDLYERAGYTVVGVAPTGRGARELREQAGIPGASTLARLLIGIERDGGLAPRTVVILDEAGMASTRETAALVAVARRPRAKLIAIGDSRQLASVEAGGWLGSLARRYGAHQLTEVMRQRDATERRLLAGVHARRPAAYLRHKRAYGQLRLYDSAPEAERALVADWRRRQERQPYGQAVMIARDNATRERLNAAARAELRAQGRLGKAVKIGEREFAVGDRVIVRRNDRHHDVDNGMRGTARAIDAKGGSLTIETDASGLRELPAAYVAEHAEHAYALTGHGMQGGTVEWAGVIGSPPEFTANWSYTALSRAREPTEIYVIADEDRFAAERAEIAPPDQHARTPLQRMAMSMLRRDDEDLALDWIEPPELPCAEPVRREPERARPAALDAPRDPARASLSELRRELAALEVRPEISAGREAREFEVTRARRVEAERVVAAARARIRALEAERRPDSRAIAYERARIERAERAREAEAAAEARLDPRLRGRRDLEAPTSEVRARRVLLRGEFERRREAHVRDSLQSPGPHLERALGPRPHEPSARQAWGRAAAAIERYRFDHQARGPSPLGNEPTTREAQLAHRRAQREIERANRRLGRELARTGGREL